MSGVFRECWYGLTSYSIMIWLLPDKIFNMIAADLDIFFNYVQFKDCLDMLPIYLLNFLSWTEMYIVIMKLMSVRPPLYHILSQKTKFMRPTWGPPGSCWPQMGPMLAPWTLLSGMACLTKDEQYGSSWNQLILRILFLWMSEHLTLFLLIFHNIHV